MKSMEYLKMLQKQLPTKSDYALAKKLGLTPQAVSLYMQGKRIMDVTTAAKVAEFLGLNPMIVIAAANAEREKGEKQEYWKNFYERLGGVAASIIFAVTFIVTPTPARAATRAAIEGMLCILC